MEKAVLFGQSEEFLFCFVLDFGKELLHHEGSRRVFGVEGNDVRGGKAQLCVIREHDSDLLVLNDEGRQFGVGVRCDVRAHLPSVEMNTMDYDRWL